MCPLYLSQSINILNKIASERGTIIAWYIVCRKVCRTYKELSENVSFAWQKLSEKYFFTGLFGNYSTGVNIVSYELWKNVCYFIVTPWKCIMWYEHWKTSVVLFGSSSLKMSALFHMSSHKKCFAC